MAEDLHGRRALVTGAARRIGRAVSLALAREGANVVIHYDHSAAAAEELRRELSGSYGVQAWTLQADFRDHARLGSFLDEALRLAGGLEILVNNASVFPRETLDELSFESVTANLQVNAWAPFVLCRELARRVDRASVVNLIDSRVDDFDWNHVGYMLSKHLLAVLTKAAALAYAPGIKVNGVAPGLILPPPGQGQEYVDRLRDTVPLKQHGDPQDIADAVLYLAKTSFVTGELIYVDGGRHLREYGRGQNPH